MKKKKKTQVTGDAAQKRDRKIVGGFQYDSCAEA